jgi:hypothetical protein
VFGVFQEYYSLNDVLQGSKGDLATVGTTSTVRASISEINDNLPDLMNGNRGYSIFSLQSPSRC